MTKQMQARPRPLRELNAGLKMCPIFSFHHCLFFVGKEIAVLGRERSAARAARDLGRFRTKTEVFFVNT